MAVITPVSPVNIPGIVPMAVMVVITPVNPVNIPGIVVQKLLFSLLSVMIHILLSRFTCI